MGEEELIAAAADGQAHAGTFLVSVYAPQLLAYARAVAPDLSDADREMICELAIEKAMKKVADYEPDRAPFGSWLRGFVRYTVLDVRRSGAYPTPTPVEDLPLQAPPLLATPDQPNPRTAELNAAIAALPETDQLYLYLRFWEDLPTKEIADRLGKSDDAVRKQLSRIVGRLRTTMTT
jgi:RNA polymerase sigma factor (sigma-70 family)